MRHPYHVACSYAYTLNRFLYKDFVSTAWLNHYVRTGDCLFEQAIPYILTAVKFIHRRHQQDLFFQWRKKEYMKKWYNIEEYEETGNVANLQTPERLLIANDFVTELHNRINTYESRSFSGQEIGEELKEVLRLKELGYKQKEIAELMGMSQQRVNYYIKKIKSIATRMQNPLRTSTVPISKRITRKTYEEKYKDEYNKWEDGNEYYNIYGNGEDVYILVREKEEELEHHES